MRRKSRALLGLLLVLCGSTQAILAGTAWAGTVIPQNVAARCGLTRAWYTQVGAAQATGQINHLQYDHGLLLVQTDRSLLSALDAETGRALWTAQVGPPNHQSTEPATNEKYVALVNGSQLYVLDRANGHILWHKAVSGTPGAGPAVSATHAFVPMVNGMIEGYSLEAGAKQAPWHYKSAGRTLIPPITTGQTVCWTTEKGYFYVADPETLNILYRLETRGTIQSRPAYWTPNLYATSTDGFVYAVNEKRGKIDWKFALGDAAYAPPVAIEGKVFIVTELSGMYCLDGKTGQQLWYAPKITQFLSTSPSRLYATDQLGRLAVLDALTGRRLGAMPLDGITLKLVNNECDRIYLANASNVLQCLREQDLRTPVAYNPPPPEKPEVAVKAKAPREKKPESADEPTEDAPEAMENDDAATDGDTPAMEEEKPADATGADAEDPFK